jgi:hypothetical protein
MSNPDLAHDPDLGTWEDQTQSALCRRCRQRVDSTQWVDGPCVIKNPEPSVAEAGPREGRRSDAALGAGLGAESLTTTEGDR